MKENVDKIIPKELYDRVIFPIVKRPIPDFSPLLDLWVKELKKSREGHPYDKHT